MATLQQPNIAPLSLTQTDLYQPLLQNSFLFSQSGNQEDYAHQLLALNGLTCQLPSLQHHNGAQNNLGVVVPNDLTIVERYQLGKELGHREYQTFAALAHPSTTKTRPQQLLALLDWWSQSYLAQYGQLLVDLTRPLDVYIGLEVISSSPIQLKQNEGLPECAFYAGILASFFSGLAGCEFDAIEPNHGNPNVKNCQFLLGSQSDLDALHFWQTVDALSS